MRLIGAFVLGLVAASVPVVSVARREECTSAQPPDAAPHYLVLTSPGTARELSCGPLSASVALEPVASATEATLRLEDESVVGVIFDRAALESLPDGMLSRWLTSSGGRRVLIGLDLTHWEVELYFWSPPGSFDSLTPDQRGQSPDLSSRPHLARFSVQGGPGERSCRGEGTIAYGAPEVLASILVQTAKPCVFN
jgi:hypothetical protein